MFVCLCIPRWLDLLDVLLVVLEMVSWTCGHVDMWIYVYVDMWTCEHVNLWTCGYVDMWTCGHLDMHTCQHVDMWTCGNMDMCICGDMWTCGHVLVVLMGVLVGSWKVNWNETFIAAKSRDVVFSEKNLSVKKFFNILQRSCKSLYSLFKHLGVLYCSDFDWSHKIHHIFLMANRKLAILRSLRFTDRRTLDYRTNLHFDQ